MKIYCIINKNFDNSFVVACFKNKVNAEEFLHSLMLVRQDIKFAGIDELEFIDGEMFYISEVDLKE